MRTAFAENDVGELQMFAETDEIAVLCLEGEFDLANAPQILEEGGRLLADDKQLILDLSDATFIDASVIDAVSRLGTDASKNGRTVVLQLGTAATVERVIQICSIDRVLPRAHTRAEAIDTIRKVQRPAAQPGSRSALRSQADRDTAVVQL
jgi:anti-anti-sigma factor